MERERQMRRVINNASHCQKSFLRGKKVIQREWNLFFTNVITRLEVIPPLEH